MEAPTLTTPDVPPFATAVAQLQKFIGNEGVLRAPVWVFREDVVSVNWRTGCGRLCRNKTSLVLKPSMKLHAHVGSGLLWKFFACWTSSHVALSGGHTTKSMQLMRCSVG